MYRLKIVDHFAAAHQLKGYEGACEDLHGHNWKVEAVIQGETLDSVGMLMDFKHLKERLREVLTKLDHKFLNDLDAFQDINPSSELLARHIFLKLHAALPSQIEPVSVTVWESDRACATYYE